VSTPAGFSGFLHHAYSARNLLAKFALFFFGIALWSRGPSLYAYYLLIAAWIVAGGGLERLKEVIKEPFVKAMLILCLLVAMGILYSDAPSAGHKVWKRYFAFLIFIPYFAVMSAERLGWAVAGLLLGYIGILFLGAYEWLAMGAQGIPPLGITYLDFSFMLATGIMLSLFFAGSSNSRATRILWWLAALWLLFMQFHQNARIILLATIISSGLLVFLLHKKNIKTLIGVMAASVLAIVIFGYQSDTFRERFMQARSDIELSRQHKYNTSLGYRLAIWDVGLHGISERPLSGHGTGMAAGYFDKTIPAYKDGIYRDLLQFHEETYHYHNDWIEIGMQIGVAGLAAYAFLLWSWFRALRLHRLAIPGAAFLCFIFLLGLTDVLVIFRQNLYLLLALTAVGITWRKSRGIQYSRAKGLPAHA
jgi:O-antigen ligase